MTFNDIFERIRSRIWISISDTELVDMILNAYDAGNIDEEEKELLLNMV